MAEDKKSLRCSFCGKHESQVHRMIQGPGVRICDECVQLCMSILDDGYMDESHETVTSVDELPQLYNVLKGDMSLVGPRPLPTYESEKCTAEQLQRLLVKPGITCYWQVCGRNDVSFDEWIEMDLRYIREQSLRTDVRILLQTVKAVISGRGAY